MSRPGAFPVSSLATAFHISSSDGLSGLIWSGVCAMGRIGGGGGGGRGRDLVVL